MGLLCPAVTEGVGLLGLVNGLYQYLVGSLNFIQHFPNSPLLIHLYGLGGGSFVITQNKNLVFGFEGGASGRRQTMFCRPDAENCCCPVHIYRITLPCATAFVLGVHASVL